ncbi:AAA family ATPase [Nocardioides convexus]|uniref:AAA family ATPase n=1 Tax=Nocardioides convexus TaxID=2712224 RepID=UPI0024188F81|nr:AAA family ATPase [Nocardioides convexus]
MYLKSLTLKGFKSFASATTLQLEPGITCIVGPNGSGKSNVVDALAWVMGEASAKSLRGGKMDDVIFAGTSGRPPLGRAEVVLTIDNSDGALPIDYSEVTISRTMFRTGGSEYAINGTTCRLLDVQESAQRLRHRPRDARHRRPGPGSTRSCTRRRRTGAGSSRRPPASSSIASARRRRCGSSDSTEGNLNRLNDLLSEIRRQAQAAGPPGRGGPACGDGPGRRARRPGAAARRRPGHRAHRAGAGARRRERAARPPPGGRERHRAGPRAGGPARGRAARGPARALGRAGDAVLAERTARALPRHPEPGRRAGAQRRRGGGRGRAGRCRQGSRRDSTPRPRGSPLKRRRSPPRSPSSRPPWSRPSPAVVRRRRRQPPRSAASPGCSAPPPTGARVWPGCTARSTRCAPGPPPRRRRSAGWRPRARTPSRAPTRPSATSPRWRPGSPVSTPARRAWTPSTRAPSPRSTTSRSASPRSARRPSRPTATRPG